MTVSVTLGYTAAMRQSLSNDTDSPIVAEGITKKFGRVTALDGLNLHVKTGEVHGFLGPNGAGKSTTIRAILGQLRLDQGHLRLFGGDPWLDAAELHKRVAYVPGDTALWPSLSGGECIDLIGGLQGSLDPRRRAELIDRFELDPRRKAGSYSKGNRQKVALVAALATQAELLLLDEPTSGLDPVMEQRFIDTVREAKAEGRTVLLSSHIMSEVEQLCDRVTIIRAGKDIVSDSLDALRAQATVRIEARWPGKGLVRRDVAPTDVVATVSRLAEQKPADLTVTPASLDELFWRHYEETSR
ncbi:Daunorubicin/doxorubicin resistance ATP-binding protein DrrA [Corynebacterium kalinowskii]|uniref:Daunorubicin/doxorubicin resistance ATP-binding protein DrrA n=2 Tax=Corynebacterium kalinowskii TaxID=2675216 RepID=A0A6B8VPE7_9CORY|nr:Daunorubicin/doxorubicin resistance ATP-binding protein DrrA [Corynebacterium kalinowskii]